jgi:hypothetical protein
MQFSLRARYEWTIAGYNLPFVQAAPPTPAIPSRRRARIPRSRKRAASVPAGCGSRIRLTRPFDASFGVAKDAWTVTSYGENLSNSNASTFHQHRSIHRRRDASAAASRSAISFEERHSGALSVA